jgi:hypothetical protein
MKSLSVLENCIDPCVGGILKAFDTAIGGAADGQAHVEMQKWLHYFASDAVGELAVSSAIDFPFSVSKFANPSFSSGVVLIFLLLARMRSDSFPRSRTYQSTAISPEPSPHFRL